MTEHSRKGWIKIPSASPNPLQLPLVVLKPLRVKEKGSSRGLQMTKQFEDPQPTPHFTKDCQLPSPMGWGCVRKEPAATEALGWGELPCPGWGEDPMGRRGSQQKELGLKGYSVQLSPVLTEIQRDTAGQGPRVPCACWLSGSASHEALRTWGSCSYPPSPRLP